jgi:hypothetical protein
MAVPKLRIRSYTENDIRSKSQSPITVTPNDIWALPEERIKSYYERRAEVDAKDRAKMPSITTPKDRVVMIVHAPDHDPASKDRILQNGMFDWSARGNHVDYLPDETVELENDELLGPSHNK